WSVITPIAMTEFGRVEIEKVTGKRPPLVYHGVHSETFHPVSPSHPLVITDTDKAGVEHRNVLTSKAACKYFLGIKPSTTLVLRTDRNMPRKGYPALIRAMAPVLREHPNVGVSLHCREQDFGGSIIDPLSKYPDILEQVAMPNILPVPRDV